MVVWMCPVVLSVPLFVLQLQTVVALIARRRRWIFHFGPFPLFTIDAVVIGSALPI